MKTKKQVSMKIDRSYKITSRELKKRIGIEGEIISISLWQGRSPVDIAQGIPADDDKWEITTKEEKEFEKGTDSAKKENKNG